MLRSPLGFPLQNGQYWICDTNKGGRYAATDLKAEIDHINTIHGANNYNLRPIIKMRKTWQAQCSVSLKSLHIRGSRPIPGQSGASRAALPKMAGEEWQKIFGPQIPQTL